MSAKRQATNDAVLGIFRRTYSIDSALVDGENVILAFERPALYFNVRLSPRMARRLAADLVKVAEASEQFIRERRERGK